MSKLASPQQWVVYAILLGLLVITVACRIFVGSATFGLPEQQAVLEFRIDQAILAAVAGVALSVSGVALQSLLRNPLAEPFILGLSTGAAAGIMLQSLLWLQLGWTVGSNEVGAMVGAIICMAIVFAVGRQRRTGMIDPLALLLTGVILSTINGSLVMLFNYLIGPGGIREDVARWMMGFLNTNLNDTSLLIVIAATLVGLIVLLVKGRAMDVASLSDDEATSLGVNLKSLRLTLFLVASILTAGAVVVAGPIAFIGLVSPHIARLLLGPSHRPLLIAASVIGATLLIAADTFTALLNLWLGIGVLPIGIFTALLGGPLFLWMLKSQPLR